MPTLDRPHRSPHHPRPWRLAAAVCLLLALAASLAQAVTARHLRGRILVDGYSVDFEPDEITFDNTRVPPEESDHDSRWQDNEVVQIHLTWDGDSIYVAADGVISANNMIVFFDTGRAYPGVNDEQGRPFQGLSRMTGLNTWRRNFVFDNGFRPDLFLATWDGNTTPQLVSILGPNQALAESPATATTAGAFRSAASFSGTLPGRSMVFAIPWWKFLGYPDSTGLERRVDPQRGDTVTVLPAGIDTLRYAAVITAGPDGTGGPDAAPDNLGGLQVDSGVQETIDNFAYLEVDSAGNAAGQPAPPDFGVNVRSRVRFLVQPPVAPIRFRIEKLLVTRPSFAPGRGQVTHFAFDVSPKLTLEQAGSRSLVLSASVYNMRGDKVRDLYTSQGRKVNETSTAADTWDGRDDGGALVPGGIYLVRVVLEPELARVVAPVVVVR
ncbi:MAG: hypothetical protein HZB25_01715 [Candidatus Eisenbacteria bacterium]|nr:hypothetical protein [Candidatus Eisenbacteria bacterium]